MEAMTPRSVLWASALTDSIPLLPGSMMEAINVSVIVVLLFASCSLCDDLIVLRTLIETRQYFSCFWRDDRDFIILSCKLADRIQRIECHDRDKLDLLTKFTAQ